MLQTKIIKMRTPIFYVYHLSDNSHDYVYEAMVSVAERLWSRVWHKVAATEGIEAAYRAVHGTHTKWYEIAGSAAYFELVN